MKKKYVSLLLSFLYVFSFAQEHNNSALHFDGNSYVDLGITVGNGARTIEMWFNLDEEITSGLNDYITLIAKDVNLVNDDEFNLSFWSSSTPQPGHLVFSLFEHVNDSHMIFSDTNYWAPGIWHHVAVVIDSIQGMRMFVDGQMQQSTNSHNEATAAGTDITALGTFGKVKIRYFTGKIDEVRISTAAEYSASFTVPCPTVLPSPNTIGLWNFEEGSGNLASDSSLSGNDGNIIGGTYVKACICDNGNTLSFDGSRASLDLGSQVGNGVRTLELWFNPAIDIDANLGDYQTLVSREVNALNEDEFALLFWPTIASSPGHLMFRYSEDLNNQHIIISDTNFWQKDEWHHVAVTIDSVLGMRMFIDGRLQQSTHSFSDATAQVNAPVMVGAFGQAGFRSFYGQIEELHLASSALYTQDFMPPCPGSGPSSARRPLSSTLGLWHFNEGEGTIALDAGNGGFDGNILAAIYACDSICSIAIDLEDEFADEGFIIFPNPVKSKLTIRNKSLKTHEPVQIRMISVKGETILFMIKSWINDEIQLDIPEDIASGIYVLQLFSTEGEMYYHKIRIE